MEGIDLDFDGSSMSESPFRQRSNTWPLQRQEDNNDAKCDADANGIDESLMGAAIECGQLDTLGSSSATKKNTSRRNAWGNMSYADLITQAINGSPEKRLTLSQIYDWMVQNVPYFKDKGDSNSSAGWKVSDRFDCALQCSQYANVIPFTAILSQTFSHIVIFNLFSFSANTQ